ncbi:MAG: putative Phospholipid-transporting ATPase 1, partial [Streblomastix strix]
MSQSNTKESQSVKQDSNSSAPSPFGRKFQIFDPENETQFTDNTVHTAKYTWWNFLPVAIFEQLRRVSNFYFLFQMIMNLLPGVGVFSPVTAIIPVGLVIGIGILKDGIEDLRRHKADRIVNRKAVCVFRGKEFEQIETCKIRVGDVLVLKGNEEICADAIILASTDRDGIAYVNTMNLDGETNLKIKRVPLQLMKQLGCIPLISLKE